MEVNEELRAKIQNRPPAGAASTTEPVSVHEATKTHHCKTPGCEGEAKASWGRHSYCPDCQVRRRDARRSDVDPDELREKIVNRK